MRKIGLIMFASLFTAACNNSPIIQRQLTAAQEKTIQMYMTRALVAV